MNASTRIGLSLLPLALAIGIAGDGLLRAMPWGLNIFLWLLVGAAALAVLAVRLPLTVEGQGAWLACPALLLAAGIAWRDSLTLQILDILGICVCLAVGSARMRTRALQVAGILDIGLDCLFASFQTSFGPFQLLFRDIAWKEIPRIGWLPQILAILRGLIFVLPLLLLFGGLLMAADAIYSHLVSQLLHFDINSLCSHLFLTGFFAWIVGGYGRSMMIANAPTLPAEKREKIPSLGRVETATILSGLNLLFLSFVVVQIHYFFGGAHIVQSTLGLTYAQYARTGFFELVWVGALLLPLLLTLHWLQLPGDPRAQRLFSWLATVQIGLLFVIMASAWMRMQLYQREYGLTELRLYTSAFMVWLAVVFVWFALTVLRGQRDRFAFGAGISAFCLIVVLHIINPDSTIARTNLARAEHGHTFDADYAASLSADAVPTLTAALTNLPATDQVTLASRLLPTWSDDRSDWRSWNWSRAHAIAAVRTHREVLLRVLHPSVPMTLHQESRR